MKRSIEIGPSASITAKSSALRSGDAGIAGCRFDPNTSAARRQNEPQADEHQRQRKWLAHRKPTRQQNKRAIRFQEKFDKKACETISNQEYPKKTPGFIAPVGSPEQK